MEIKDFILKRIAESKKLSTSKKRKLASGVEKIKLTKTQEWGLKMAHSSPKRILGESVKFIYNEIGIPTNLLASIYLGTILKLQRPRDTMPRLEILWEDDKRTSVWLFQIDFTKENVMLSPEERKKIIEDKLVKEITKASNTVKEQFKKDLTEANKTLEEYLLRIRKGKIIICDLKEKIKKAKVHTFNLGDLEEEFKMVKKLKTIEDIYVSAKGNIVVLTKNLPAIGVEKLEFSKDTKLGRFVFVLNYLNNRILINNRDWVLNEKFGHPHLDGTETCWGHHGQAISKMFKQGKIFQLVDFILTFYSTYPQDNGSPHVDYDQWLNERVEVKNDELLEPKI